MLDYSGQYADVDATSLENTSLCGYKTVPITCNISILHIIFGAELKGDHFYTHFEPCFFRGEGVQKGNQTVYALKALPCTGFIPPP